MEVEDTSEIGAAWATEARAYHVYFWTQMSDPDPPAVALWRSDVKRVSGVSDVIEVLAWAEEHAEGRTVTIWLEVPAGGRFGLIQIHGIDPTVDT